MQHEKKYWEAYLNGDDADAFVQFTEYINCKDFRFGVTSDKGFAKQLESVGGTALIPNAMLPDDPDPTIGVAYDWARRRTIYFTWNSDGNHYIWCYDYLTNRIYALLFDAQVTGGLNFDKNHLIHSARVENGCVYWTDNLNEPRRINIDAAIKMNLAIIKTSASISFGYLQTIFTLPAATQINYGDGVTLTMIRTGTGGAFAAPTRIDIPLDWTNYPAITAKQVVVNGLLAYLNSIGTPIIDFTVGSGAGITVRIAIGWDFGTGDPAYAPTTAIELVFNDSDIAFGTTAAYTAPLRQSVISWIRRQPGLPPVGIKTRQTFPVVTANQIANEAFTFSYRYVYKDYEVSTLSGQSILVNVNPDGDDFNLIQIFLPQEELIEQDVIQVDLVANYLISGVNFIIKSWRKADPVQAAQIAAHNAGGIPLQMDFFNDQVGIALDAGYTTKLFDLVPLRAQTLEMAKSRAFFSNYLTGYTTPIDTSLSITTTSIDFDGSGGSITGTWFLLNYKTLSPNATGSAYLLYTTTNLGGYPPTGQYWFTWNSAVPPFPASVNFADLLIRGFNFSDTVRSFAGGAFAIIPTAYTNQGTTSIIVTGTVPPSFIVGQVFKSNASYQLSINFKDNYGRESGILTKTSLLFMTPDTGLSTSTYINTVNWLLSNANALAEIPDWAYYYTINITKCLRTRFFLQSLGVIIYAAKDVDNVYTFTTTAYTSDLAGVAIDLSFLVTHAQGYVFSEGDVVELFVNGASYNLSIIGQSAQWIVCQLLDVGSLAATTGMFEIYTPYKKQANEPYFEVAQIYAVTNPGTSSRSYSALTGIISGDVPIFRRSNSSTVYFTEAMNPNDKFYKDWFTNAGRPNFIDFIGQVSKPTSYCFSNTFIPGSQNNGLSTFDALDSGDISPDFGPIQKLQISSKVQKIGSVMLAICSGPTTASMYLGENTLISQTGDAVVAQANTVVGSIHELKGGFGTLNPESVVEFRGNIYWFDVQNGKIIQYAENGLFPISNYKLSRFWKLFSDQYKSMTAAQIEALGSRPFVFGTVDPHHGELLFTVPRTLATPPMGFLPDYPDTPYPFDIWDGQAKTLVFKLYAEPNRWQGSYSFAPDYMFYLEDNLYTFKNGSLYLHNQTNYCQYYGVQYAPAIMDLCNQQLNKPRVPNNYSVEGNKAPSLVYFMTRYPYIQATDLITADFSNKEGIYYAAILRNKLDPAFNNEFGNALLAGEELRATAIYMMGQWNATQGIVQVKFTNISYTISLGQPV